MSLSVTYEKLPIVQKVMAASSVSGSATYFINPRTEDMRPHTIMPDKTSVIFDLLLIAYGISTVSKTATIPPRKAIPCMAIPESERSIATAAPIQAPLETPRKSGATSGFLKMP